MSLWTYQLQEDALVDNVEGDVTKLPACLSACLHCNRSQSNMTNQFSFVVASAAVATRLENKCQLVTAKVINQKGNN